MEVHGAGAHAQARNKMKPLPPPLLKTEGIAITYDGVTTATHTLQFRKIMNLRLERAYEKKGWFHRGKQLWRLMLMTHPEKPLECVFETEDTDLANRIQDAMGKAARGYGAETIHKVR